MKPARKRCEYCGREYEADPHTVKQQKACARLACRRARRRQKQRCWRALNPDYERSRRDKRRAWAKGYPDYYREYRAAHPGYAARDDLRRVRSRRAKVSANVTALRRAVVEKAGKLGPLEEPGVSANVTALSRRVAAVEDCLRSTVEVMVSANETDMARQAGAGR